MPRPVNHDEAWSLACFKRDESNLARCYIEAIETLRKVYRIYGHETGDGAEGDALAAVRLVVLNAPVSYASDAGGVDKP